MTIEPPCELFRPLDHTQRLGRIDGPARALDDRSVNQLAAESPGVRGRPTLSRWNLSNLSHGSVFSGLRDSFWVSKLVL